MTSTAVDIRQDLIKRIRKDLEGPAEGEHERLSGPLGRRRVRDRYLVGMLAPKNTVWLEESRSDDDGVGDDAEEGGGSVRPPAKPVLMPSSMGLSFAVLGTETKLTVTVSWGHYMKEQDEGEDGRPGPAWQRYPVRATTTLNLPPSGSSEIPAFAPHPDAPNVYIEGVARRSASGAWLVTLFLRNDQETPDRNKDEAWLFQASLTVEASSPGSAVFIGRTDALGGTPKPPPTEERLEVEMLDLQYRDVVEFAVGHGVATYAKVSDDPTLATRVETVHVPDFELGRTQAPSPTERPQLSGVVLDMKVLAETADSDLEAALLPLANGYAAWIKAEKDRINDARIAAHGDAARRAIMRAEVIEQALRTGITSIASDPEAAEAFRFANRAMWQQRIRTVAAELRRNDKSLASDAALAEADDDRNRERNRSWRPFQLAFLCLVAPSILDPHHEDRSTDPTKALADLLFFPTGGGKTEAYLGLVAFTFAVRRLQGKRFGSDASDGVAVIMRYTLRALTAQQFERAAALVAACEMTRRNDPARWGSVPFRLGMYVGRAVTPNGEAEARSAVRRLRSGRAQQSSPMQLSNCPWCATPLDPNRLQSPEGNPAKRTLLFCADPTGTCPFTPLQAPDEGIPVVTVDDELYRLLPSFIIGTVDKLAQLPWKGETSALFGRVVDRCPRHGWRSADLDKRLKWETDSHRADGAASACTTEKGVGPLRPPDLIIQDEMHLINGPLGTMAGLYETAVDRLATWTTQTGVEVRPKVVASTATIRRAEQQAWGVFWRKLRMFPPPVLDAGDSFFARQVKPTEDAPGRLYLGVCAHGRRLKEAENRVFATIMAAAQALYRIHGLAADPWMTCVGYFNAIRELAGMKRLADDELNRRLQRAWNFPGLEPRYLNEVVELTSRVSAPQIRETLDDLRIKFDPRADAARAKAAERRKKGEKVRGEEESAEWLPRPVDLLLATNMISVGVDVPRLGLMVTVGQPKATAEYIQATSRVGRSDDGPGLVLTLYNWSRPRDLSHYETFGHYHATFYRRVEALSVTPFAPRALDRGLTAVLVSLLRHDANPAWNPNPGAAAVPAGDPLIDAAGGHIENRSRLVDQRPGIGALVDNMVSHRAGEHQDEIRRRARGGSSLAWDGLLQKAEHGPWNIWSCPNSMRETEPNINLIIDHVDPTYMSAPDWAVPPTRSGGETPAHAADGATRPRAAEDDEVDLEGEEESDRAAAPAGRSGTQ